MIVSRHCGYWPQNRGLLQEQKALLTSESPLQPKIRNSRDFSMNLETAKLHLSVRGLRWSPPALSQFRRLPPTSHPASPCFPPLPLYLTKCPGRAEQLQFSDESVQTHYTVRKIPSSGLPGRIGFLAPWLVSAFLPAHSLPCLPCPRLWVFRHKQSGGERRQQPEVGSCGPS